MKNITKLSFAAAAAFAAYSAPSQAATCVLADVQYATACAGYVAGNTIFNTANNSVVLGLLDDLGYGSLYTSAQLSALWSNPDLKLSGLNGATDVSFAGMPTLSGLTLLGVHWGGQGGGQNAIYLLNIPGSATSINLDGQNPGGTSDAVMFLTAPSAVPEPASWALLIAGLGVVGASMRRRKTEISFG
jgi:hypothetical protein